MFVPMKAGKLKPQVDRTYRESHALQWVREAFINAKEAGASRVSFGIEWEGVRATGTYRRIIADDGIGISPDDHARFFNTFGGGAKPIGGAHENYGIGFKTSVLPWNRFGVAIISLRDGVESMSRICLQEASDEYGMRAEQTEDDEWLTFWSPDYDSELKLNWHEVVPAFVREKGQGTVIVLLGNHATQDTILGDPSRPSESGVDAIVRYINSRFWDLSDVKVTVDSVMNRDKSKWPAADAAKSGGGRATTWTTISPTGIFKATIDRDTEGSRLAHRGSVVTPDGVVEMDWFLREGLPLPSSRAQNTGFVASLYHSEIYGLVDHAALLRSFGVGALREHVFIVLRPREATNEIEGVYPDTSRTGLKLGGPNGGIDLPMSDWAQYFASHLPPELIAAIKASFKNLDGQIDDEEWKKRLQERFGASWKIPKLAFSSTGSQKVKPVQPAGITKKKNPLKQLLQRVLPANQLSEKTSIGNSSDPGSPAVAKSVAGGLPSYRVVSAEEIGNNGAWALAAYAPPNSAVPSGQLLLNRDHPILAGHVREISSKYPAHLEDAIRKEVYCVYAEIGVAHIAHSEQMKKLLPAERVEQEFRSESALTMALLGLWQIEAIALPRLQGKLQQAQIKK